MVEPTPRTGTRIGSSERDAALTSLGEHMRAGRLDPDEYSERAEKVSKARYTDELAPLFGDLPPATAQLPKQQASADEPIGQGSGPRRILAAAPIVSLLLFFAFGFLANGWAWSWLFFLLTPLVGAILFGDRRAARDRTGRDRPGRDGRR